jgi:hypothetical protein
MSDFLRSDVVETETLTSFTAMHLAFRRMSHHVSLRRNYFLEWLAHYISTSFINLSWLRGPSNLTNPTLFRFVQVKYAPLLMISNSLLLSTCLTP